MHPFRDEIDPTQEKDIITEITLDEFMFQVTSNPSEFGSCILWVRSINVNDDYRTLGKFKRYEKKKVLDFIIKYSSNEKLREEVREKRFARKLETLRLNDFAKIHSSYEKEGAFKNLFDLDCTVRKDELAKRRRLMAKKFHPDRGGDNLAMSIINEAYSYLLSNVYN